MAKPRHEKGKAGWPREEAKSNLARGGEERSQQACHVTEVAGQGWVKLTLQRNSAGLELCPCRQEASVCTPGFNMFAQGQSPSGP